MRRRRLWLLNFDADDELARPAGYTPPRELVRRFAALAARAQGLVPQNDEILTEWDHSPRSSGTTAASLDGRAFSATPRALRALIAAGAEPPVAPPLLVLQRVNHRAFCAELGQTLPAARFVRTFDDLEVVLASRRGPWILKRPFGYAGRGQARLRDHRIDASVLPFVRASLEANGGLQVEPWVERLIDVGLHGFVAPGGEVTLGAPTRMIVDERGAWVRSARLESGELEDAELGALFREAERTARALASAGYFGPFGIDAFRYRDQTLVPAFNPRCEINARYSMGWAVGMGNARPDL